MRHIFLNSKQNSQPKWSEWKEEPRRKTGWKLKRSPPQVAARHTFLLVFMGGVGGGARCKQGRRHRDKVGAASRVSHDPPTCLLSGCEKQTWLDLISCQKQMGLVRNKQMCFIFHLTWHLKRICNFKRELANACTFMKGDSSSKPLDRKWRRGSMEQHFEGFPL